MVLVLLSLDVFLPSSEDVVSLLQFEDHVFGLIHLIENLLLLYSSHQMQVQHHSLLAKR